MRKTRKTRKMRSLGIWKRVWMLGMMRTWKPGFKVMKPKLLFNRKAYKRHLMNKYLGTWERRQEVGT